MSAPALQDQLELAQTKLSHVQQARRNVDHATALAREVQVEIERHQQLLQQIHQVEEQVQANQQQTAEVLQQKEERERTLHRTEEKIAHTRKQHKIKMDAAQEALEAAQMQLLEVEKDRREGMARIEAGEAEVVAMEAKIEEESKKTRQEIDEMIAEFRITEQAILQEEEEFMAAIGAE